MAPLAAGAPRRRGRGAGSGRLTPRAKSPAKSPAKAATKSSTGPRHVAFLRAINVGGHVVTMERLRAILAGLPGAALRDVETFIASGNVAFTTTARDIPALEQRIAHALHAALGYEVATFVRDIPALVRLAGATHFPEAASDHAVHVGFLHAAPSADATARLMKFGDAINTFVVDGRELWWWSKGRSSESGIDGGKLERALGMPMTMRNVNTVRRLSEKYGG